MKGLSCSLSNGTKYTMKMFRIFRKKATGNTGSFSEPKKALNYLKFGSIKLLHRTFREDLIMSIGLLHVCAKIVCFLFFYIYLWFAQNLGISMCYFCASEPVCLIIMMHKYRLRHGQASAQSVLYIIFQLLYNKLTIIYTNICCLCRKFSDLKVYYRWSALHARTNMPNSIMNWHNANASIRYTQDAIIVKQINNT